MPNSGMLDHRAYNGRVAVHWMSSWPKATGYETLRFSRHMQRQVLTIKKEYSLSKRRPHTAIEHTPGSNSMSPFYTVRLKPTCGYHYKPNTDHRRFKIGLHPSDLVSWRYRYSGRPRTQIAT
ncbi:PREDICTED: uncharacterized protein LOC100635953 [Amphimedon queenslandica]|uniref:Uncharacterized protein n=1 Tax=Amphimedon queenslandica TaxID=400682 RepID=A0A1X7UDT5_AMPQE|nr:PREDICTED: uncharacterized protein LOC100635953 [Amphimedon queenslandica]|eukprot:XP_003388197.1 PREDICTED: uncharacterized protein LOC100635953 [Amphimedon queenslandica]